MIRTAVVAVAALSAAQASAGIVTITSTFTVQFAAPNFPVVMAGDSITFAASYERAGFGNASSAPLTSLVSTVPFPGDIVTQFGGTGSVSFADGVGSVQDEIGIDLGLVTTQSAFFIDVDFFGLPGLLDDSFVPTAAELDASLIVGGSASVNVPNPADPQGGTVPIVVAQLESVVITPTPASAALLGFGGLAMARRRR
ncbi:MAG: hypothetical protein AAF747_02840 [Planctomycetota bacterium]